MGAIQVVYYRKENGEVPVISYLDTLDVKMAAKVVWTIQLFQEMGADLRLPYSEYLKDGIYELRAKQGSNISRVMYFFIVGNKAVLTHGFTKKTQKTPSKEIKLAMKYREDYMRRLLEEECNDEK